MQYLDSNKLAGRTLFRVFIAHEWATSNGVLTNIVAFKRSEFIEKQYVKNVTVLRLEKTKIILFILLE